MTPRKAQSSIEYLTIVSVSLAVLVPILVFGFNTLRGSTADSEISQAQSSLENLAEVADSVCVSPTGTKKRASLIVPSQARLGLSGFGLKDRVLNIAVRTDERDMNLTAVTDCQLVRHKLSDQLSNPGNSFFTAVKEGDGLVNITRAR